ncbi:TrmB family transcriptional regulator [Hydrogenispora ethanolica]|jgi:sugar-specific transcriptional regulator TrmB|uniref:TrmB family transcriptional regulator n=1 Tax=Hydrogenispora ethanolica TaxID=1082276 RepID=A0A4R1R2Z6_HYDET|nr:helix-turn-helix domain-containing protein [Hydrogenispora ethanolica]TCL59770.1 TrmB family transcriptional regulator [Hydrogenispora ethanolica]
MNEVLLKLEKLGLSPYEAKAYIALTQRHPANGYEISKLARIPPSKIYETLSKLKHKGMVIVDEQIEPVQYYPIPHEKLLHQLRQDYVATIDELGAELRQIQPLPQIDLAWNLMGYPAVLDKLHQLIENAAELLMVSLWPAEYRLLEAALDTAEARGVRVIAGIFGECGPARPNRINLENCGATSSKRLGSHLTVVVADSAEVVIAEIADPGDSMGIWTATPGVVLVAKEYIKHDLWGRVLINALGESAFQKLCGDDALLAFLIENR